jgi:carbonic anhydrase
VVRKSTRIRLRHNGEGESEKIVMPLFLFSPGSLVISHKLLGTRECFVVHHTNCGMVTFTDEITRGLLAENLDTATYDGKKWRDTGKRAGSPEGQFVNWLPIRDQAESICADVKRFRSHPLAPSGIPTYGYISNVRSGLLQEVSEATRIGNTS